MASQQSSASWVAFRKANLPEPLSLLLKVFSQAPLAVEIKSSVQDLQYKQDDKKKDAGKSPKKDKDPADRSGGKAKKKKWARGKVRDKLNDLVLFAKAMYDQLRKEVPTISL